MPPLHIMESRQFYFQNIICNWSPEPFGSECRAPDWRKY